MKAQKADDTVPFPTTSKHHITAALPHCATEKTHSFQNLYQSTLHKKTSLRPNSESYFLGKLKERNYEDAET